MNFTCFYLPSAQMTVWLLCGRWGWGGRVVLTQVLMLLRQALCPLVSQPGFSRKESYACVCAFSPAPREGLQTLWLDLSLAQSWRHLIMEQVSVGLVPGVFSLISSIFEVEKVKASAGGKNTLMSVRAFQGVGRRGIFLFLWPHCPGWSCVDLYNSAIQSYPAWVPNQERNGRPGQSSYSFTLSSPEQVPAPLLPGICSLKALVSLESPQTRVTGSWEDWHVVLAWPF